MVGVGSEQCLFCTIIAGDGEVSMVYQDDIAVVFMDLNPINPGHLLVVPRSHAVGLEDLDADTSAHVWSLGHQMARALRRTNLRCEGINVFLADGEAAFQEVLHFHLHVFPRFAGDGFSIVADSKQRCRDLLDQEADIIAAAVTNQVRQAR